VRRDALARARARADAAGDVDLVPVMNLVAMLIPLLLLSSRLGGLAVIDTEPAVQAGGTAADVQLTVRADGFDVDGPTALAPLRCVPGPCPDSERWPYAALTAALADVREAQPDARRLVLVAEPEVPYDVIVRAMDAARTDARDPAAPRPLFPQVVVSTAGGGSR
jgi:hypothetical protein